MSFVRPTLSELIERARGDIETRLPAADSRLRHSVLDVLARTHSGAAAGLYGYLDFLARQLMPDTAEAEYLARWSSIWGVYRKAATAARVTLAASGVNGSVIPAGTELQRIDGTLYRTRFSATIVSGSALLSADAVEAGVAGDLAIYTALTFSSPIAGVAAEVSVSALDITGTEEEDDASLTARLLDRIRKPPQGGTSNDYVAWALAQPGVTRAWAYGAWMGLGTVGLTFVMEGRDDIIPDVGDVAEVQAALDLLRPVTAELIVFAPTAVPVDIVIRVAPDTGEVQSAISAELADFFSRDSEPGATLYRSRMQEAISLAAGEFNHDLILPGSDIESIAGELLVLGTVTFVS